MKHSTITKYIQLKQLLLQHYTLNLQRFSLPVNVIREHFGKHKRDMQLYKIVKCLKPDPQDVQGGQFFPPQ